MAIIKNVEFRGNSVISTNSGNIGLNANTGDLIVRSGDIVLARVNAQGFIYSNQNGVRNILIGAHPVDGHIINAQTARPEVDVITALGG